MFFRCSPLYYTVVAVWLLVAALRTNAEVNSPFLPPPGQQSIAAPVATAPLELRGVYEMGDTLAFSIFDPTKKSGTWVKLNERGYDFAVKKYNPDTDTVTVEYQGRTHTLTMRTPKIASLGNAVAPPPTTAMPMPAAASPSAVAAPTSPTEAARLADWATEIQRRRELRAQQAASPQTAAPANPAPAPAQNPPSDVQPRQRNQQRQRQ